MYKVYVDDKLVGETKDKQFTITDLTPDKLHTIKVVNKSGVETVEVKTDSVPADAEPPTVEVDDSLTVAEIKELLDLEGIEYTNDMRKAELLELLQESL